MTKDKSSTTIPMPYVDAEMIGKNNTTRWNNPPNAGDVTFGNHLRLMLYKKASDAYFNFGEKCLTSNK